MTVSIPPTVDPYQQPSLISSMTIRDLWHAGEVMLEKAGISNSKNQTVWILESALGLDRLTLHLRKNDEVEEPRLSRTVALFERRASREPLQYVLGTEEFCGLDFGVTPDVLIPRPETELLVEVIRRTCADISEPLIADIGTGSGCVAIALARALPQARFYATDRSPQALVLAQENAKRHGVRDRVTFMRGDMFSPLHDRRLQGQLIAIVSNPPYIPHGDLMALEPEVRLFEPRHALDGGNDGLAFHRRLVWEAPTFLKKGGLLAMEVGQGQASLVSGLAQTGQNYYNVRTFLDIAGIGRVVLAKKK